MLYHIVGKFGDDSYSVEKGVLVCTLKVIFFFSFQEVDLAFSVHHSNRIRLKGIATLPHAV